MRQVRLSLLCGIVLLSLCLSVNKTTKQITPSDLLSLRLNINCCLLSGTCCGTTRHVKQALINSAIAYAFSIPILRNILLEQRSIALGV